MEALLIDDDENNNDETLREAMVTSLAYRQITLYICTTFPEASAFLAQHTPHLIVLDLVLYDPETGKRDYNNPFGIRAARTLSRQYPQIPILIYTAHAQHFWELQAVLEAHPVGAGFLHKAGGVPALVDAMRVVVGGNRLYSLEAQETARPHSPPALPYTPEQLAQARKFTLRELETCKYAAEGLSLHQIAQHMGIAPNTAGQHISRMYKKLGINRDEHTDTSDIHARTFLINLYSYLRDRGELPPH